jgi:hypothetical protein
MHIFISFKVTEPSLTTHQRHTTHPQIAACIWGLRRCSRDWIRDSVTRRQQLCHWLAYLQQLPLPPSAGACQASATQHQRCVSHMFEVCLVATETNLMPHTELVPCAVREILGRDFLVRCINNSTASNRNIRVILQTHTHTHTHACTHAVKRSGEPPYLYQILASLLSTAHHPPVTTQFGVVEVCTPGCQTRYCLMVARSADRLPSLTLMTMRGPGIRRPAASNAKPRDQRTHKPYRCQMSHDTTRFSDQCRINCARWDRNRWHTGFRERARCNNVYDWRFCSLSTWFPAVRPNLCVSNLPQWD